MSQGSGVRSEKGTEPGEGNIIIKTTYDISLDFQDSLLPLGFLSRPSLTPAPFVPPSSFHSLRSFSPSGAPLGAACGA